jgi:RNA polymerase sigma factor (sigma-70 family)
MSGLVDTGGSGRALSGVARLRADHEERAIEREYREHREAVLGMLGAQFPRLGDPEELYQEAWAELLALERRGERVRHRRALLKTIAWRRAADAVKQRRRVVAVDPAGLVLENAADQCALPDEQAQRHLDGEALRLVVESLGEREATVLKLRFDCQLSAKEVQVALGIGEKRLEVIVTRAYRKIAEQLEVGTDGTTAWTRRQRSLLLACELGIASARQRRHAQQMLERDPACRALLRAMRRGLDDVAAVLPVPVLVDEHDRVGRLGRATAGRLDELLAGARHVVERVAGRGVADSGLVEQAGLGGASAGLTALAVKAVAVCVVVGGAAVVCLGGSSRLTDHPAKAAPVPRHEAARVVEPPRDHVTVVRTPAPTRTTKHTTTTTQRKAPPSSSPESRPAASPAPKGSTEFGPGALGSSSAPEQPAAAPQDGGGEFTP